MMRKRKNDGKEKDIISIMVEIGGA